MTVGFKNDTSGTIRTNAKPNEVRTLRMEISALDEIQEIEF